MSTETSFDSPGTSLEQKKKDPRAHLWKKGQSGNINGRPKGSRNAISLVKMQIESELRAQTKDRMGAVMDKIYELAMEGDTAMLALLHKSWISSTRATDDETPKEPIQINIGKLDQIPTVNGRTFTSTKPTEE